MNRSHFFILIFLILFNTQAFAAGKYCSPSGKKYDLHVFGNTFENESQQKLALRGISDLKNKFKYGDRVRVFIYQKNEYFIEIDACVPGCPEKSFTEQLFSSECSVMVAKKDFQEFQKNFASKIVSSFKNSVKDYDIFQSLQSLADVYKNTSQKDAIYSAISLIPKGIDPKNRSQLNSLYISKRETIQFPTTFPKVKLIGNSTDQELITFWSDVFKGKADFEFDKY
jgi:hypothetical protein